MNRMKQLREEQGLTMKEASIRLGLPYTTYVNYEKGFREPNSEMLISISSFFNCSIDYLLCKSDDRLDEATLDAALEIEPFLLSLTGNIHEAQKIQNLIDNNQSDKAYEYYLSLVTPSASSVLEQMHLTISDHDPQIEEIVIKCESLTAQTLEKVKTYIDDLRYNPESIKKKPSKEG